MTGPLTDAERAKRSSEQAPQADRQPGPTPAERKIAELTARAEAAEAEAAALLANLERHAAYQEFPGAAASEKALADEAKDIATQVAGTDNPTVDQAASVLLLAMTPAGQAASAELRESAFQARRDFAKTHQQQILKLARRPVSERESLAISTALLLGVAANLHRYGRLPDSAAQQLREANTTLNDSERLAHTFAQDAVAEFAVANKSVAAGKGVAR